MAEGGSVRPARPSDVPEVLAMVRDLAAYERSLEQVELTEATLTALLFGGSPLAPGVAATTGDGRAAAFCHVVERGGDDESPTGTTLAGFALWFLNVSTWTGTHGVYLEDLYVRPEARGRGFARALMGTLARLCVERGYRRLEWWVLDWNEPALGFYRRLGAEPMADWTVQRLSGRRLLDLAQGR